MSCPEGTAWTADQQRLYERLIEQKFSALEQQIKWIGEGIALAEKLAQRADVLSSENMSKWMAEHNQFMARALEKDKTYATHIDLGRAEERIDRLEMYRSNQEGRFGMLGIVWTILTVVLAAAVAFAARAWLP